ncbi:hypothetical protein GON03_07875 [Nocardioides sp. MAH-18]|uniref:Phytanoyl-CoA dioxygenase family protein n=1 Tax=Nocardioides agri TaxID=2682843 RepID=A0A6L6XR00_9ACTN|nr:MULTISPECIES: hypothetical protein [unclassified Nocardioides]MBA2954236.1 hypothetical protein [Nocardioides sp. CGMCC 1.13656]MVQ49097.1 hypothetical protein [Nocardioides sp. MAH-18]
MTSVIVDPTCTDDERRHALYSGDIFVHTHSPSIREFVSFTRAMIEDAFGGRDPETVQYDMDVNEYAEVLGALKPAFIHHPESKTHLRAILEEHGADPELTYFDVPRLRTSTSDNYLTTGIAYAFHPHRDTWYSAPMMQLNWWLPIYDVTPDNVVAFHPRYFDRAVANGSERYNYYAWNRDSRAIAASQVGEDTRDQPKPEEPIDLDPQIRPVPPVGGVMVFSGAQLHSSVPNTSGRTRISVDFRVVHRGDVEAGRGAVNVDSHCTGTTMRDYLRVADMERLPAEVVAPYDEGVPEELLQYAIYSS